MSDQIQLPFDGAKTVATRERIRELVSKTLQELPILRIHTWDRDMMEKLFWDIYKAGMAEGYHNGKAEAHAKTR